MSNDIPRLKGKLLGFRRWRVDKEELSPAVDMEDTWIKPFFDEQPWQPGENASRCKLGHHRAPEADCNCGWNAWDSYLRARFYKKFLYLNQTVTGIVSGSGLVYLHESGWRAEKAEVIAFVSSRGNFVLRDWKNIEAEAKAKEMILESSDSFKSKAQQEELYLPNHKEFDKRSTIKRLGGIYEVPVLENKSELVRFVKNYRQLYSASPKELEALRKQL